MLSWGFCRDSRSSENWRKWKDRQILGSCLSSEKAVRHERDSDSWYGWCTWIGRQGLGKEIIGIWNQRKNRDYLENINFKINQNDVGKWNNTLPLSEPLNLLECTLSLSPVDSFLTQLLTLANSFFCFCKLSFYETRYLKLNLSLCRVKFFINPYENLLLTRVYTYTHSRVCLRVFMKRVPSRLSARMLSPEKPIS